MTRFLALDWEQGRPRLAAATVQRGSVRLQRAAVWQEEELLTAATAVRLGQRLRERLKAWGLTGWPLLMTIGRSQVVLKEINYPPVAPADEPALVRFQAAKDLTEAPEDVVIDYVLRPPAPGDQNRHALAVIVRRQQVEMFQGLARAAGVKLLALAPRFVGLEAALHRACLTGTVPAPDPLGLAIVLMLTGHGAELCAVRGEQVIFSRALVNGAGLVSELRRNLVVLSHQQGQAQVAWPVYVASDEDEAVLRPRLQGLSDGPLHFFGPLGPDDRSRLAVSHQAELTAAVGLLQAYSRRQALLLNFVAPKQPPPPSRSARKLLVVAGVAGLLLFMLGGLFAFQTLAAKKREIANLTAAKADLDEQLKLLSQDAKDLEFLKDWEQGTMPWLDEFYDLAARFPHQLGLRLTQLKAEPLGKRGPKDKYDARLTLTGIVPRDEENRLTALVENINHDRHCRATLERVRSGKEVSDFTIKIDLAKQSPERFLSVLTPPPSGGKKGSKRPMAAEAEGGGP